MNDQAYDISHLEAELMAACEPRVRSEPKAAPTLSLVVSVAAAQEAMARELMLAADFHEDMIRQYLSISGEIAAGDFMH
jgi:hypothetical protein